MYVSNDGSKRYDYLKNTVQFVYIYIYSSKKRRS